VGCLNQEVDRLSEAEGEAQERLWRLEDEITGLQTITYGAQAVCERMADVMRDFPTLDAGERKRWAESSIAGGAVKEKDLAPEAAGVLTDDADWRLPPGAQIRHVASLD
jgi:hypothetical protein